MKFKWQAFCDEHNIHYVERGPNVQRGNINIACPLCGDDPSHHLGLVKDSGTWGCWRDPAHAGRRPHRLVMALLGVSYHEACSIIGDTQAPLEDLDSLEAQLNQLDPRVGITEPIGVEFTKEIKTIDSNVSERAVLVYLLARGYSAKEARRIIKTYELRYALTGEHSKRIILPIHYYDKVVGWTGRAIGLVKPKYKEHPRGGQVKNCLFNHMNALSGGNTLVIVEGPFDAVNVDFYGMPNIRSVATLGVKPTSKQVSLLVELSTLYDRTVITYDDEAEAQAMELQSKLRIVRPELLFLPNGYDDPGDLCGYHVENLYGP